MLDPHRGAPRRGDIAPGIGLSSPPGWPPVSDAAVSDVAACVAHDDDAASEGLTIATGLPRPAEPTSAGSRPR